MKDITRNTLILNDSNGKTNFTVKHLDEEFAMKYLAAKGLKYTIYIYELFLFRFNMAFKNLDTSLF